MDPSPLWPRVGHNETAGRTERSARWVRADSGYRELSLPLAILLFRGVFVRNGIREHEKPVANVAVLDRDLGVVRND